jgi:NitT/TauT family transport system substrate-binding protein
MIRGKSKRMMNPVILLTAVLFTVVCFGAFAGGIQEAVEPTVAEVIETEAVEMNIKVVVLKGPSGFAAAKLLGDNFQPGQNVNAEYLIASSPLEAVAKMTSGEADAAFLPVNTAAKLYSKGPGFKLAAVSGLGSLYMVSSDKSVKTWNDLRGKKIYLTGKGATPDYLLRYLLSENGLDPEVDVQLDFTAQAPQIAQLLIAGRAELAFIPQPFVLMAELKSDAAVVLDPQEELMRLRGTSRPFPFTAFVLSPRLTSQRPQAAAALTQALGDSITWVNENPAEAAAVIEARGIMTAAIAESAIPVSGIEYIPASEAKAEVVDFLDMLLVLDPVSVGGSLPDEGFYFNF